MTDGGWMSFVVIALASPATVVLTMMAALLERSGPIRLQHWAEEAGGGLREVYAQPSRFEAFRLLMSVLARLAPLALLGALWAVLREPLGTRAVSLATVAVVVLLLVVEWLNRQLVGRHAETALRRLTVPMALAHAVLRPLTWVLGRFLVPAIDDGDEVPDDEASEDEIEAFIDVGRREGILEPEEGELLRSLVDFGDTQVRSVMTPRVEIVSAPIDASLEELAEVFFESKHARLPLYRGSIDHIVGILHIRDLFETLHRGRQLGAAELSNPPHNVPETKALPALLEELQARHEQMAIVVDEYGGVAGLVTVEDLVEEIVGDISDEHETEEALTERVDELTWRLRGRAHVEELSEIFDDLDEDFDEMPYETLSGLICGAVGSVPAPGTSYHAHGLIFFIEEADDRRVEQVRVRRAVETEPAEESA